VTSGKQVLSDTYKHARRVVIAIVGGSVVVVGILMIALPGPAIVVIPTGLAILSIEFAWARRWLRKLKAKTQDTVDYFNRDRESSNKS
jgi:tellurite resistance protein TerC